MRDSFAAESRSYRTRVIFCLNGANGSEEQIAIINGLAWRSAKTAAVWRHRSAGRPVPR